ncbi:MAG TPA: hypothetical protein VFT01_00490 [Homoserinimonas sp.]|nr:hypothetical protein [Homoserinimonas sp.]
MTSGTDRADQAVDVAPAKSGTTPIETADTVLAEEATPPEPAPT